MDGAKSAWSRAHQGRHRRHHPAASVTRPDEFDVIATTNLNGDYISDALAAQVGGSHRTRRHINYMTGHLIRATHGTAPIRESRQGESGSGDPFGEMMFRYMGWVEAADAIITAMDPRLARKRDL